jgi:hypothetical protein
MKICAPHWDLVRQSVDKFGMSDLGAKSSEEAHQNTVDDLNQVPDPNNERFDPLMSHNWHWVNSAMRNGGLYLMMAPEDGSNDGHFCPLCEYEKHSPGFVASEAIDLVSGQMADYCRSEGLISQIS